ncbi:hypothetical protein NBRC116592_06530 [Colwellia sp. KU-HH00111]|uniref:tetratricopeptide repeat protein n=1 Tax=Colwellia sp. KU-HH00111 TaxID=3127652 RepID=UPI003106957B
MGKHTLCFIVLITTAFAIEANTFKEDAAFTQLKQLITANEQSSAWHYAKTLEAEYLGDADFDFLYGLIALRVNETERAVYAFERVVANKPNWLDARYYLANGYFKMKNYHGVIDIVNAISLIENIPDNLKASFAKLQAMSVSQLNKQAVYVNHSLAAKLGYDSNINAGTREENILAEDNILGEDILLSNESRENSDNYLALDYQLIGSKALTQTSKLVFSGLGQLHAFANESNYNRLLVDARVNYQKEFENFTTSVGLKVTPLWLDDSYYRTQFGSTIAINKQINNQWFVSTEAYLGKTNNSVNEQLNTSDLSLQMAAQFALVNWRHTLSFAVSQEQSEHLENSHNDKQTKAINYSSLWLINPQWLASVNIGYQHQAYQDKQPFFLETRSDDMWLLGTSIQYQYSNVWIYRISANIQDKDSNIPLFSYQRSDISFSVSMSF